MSDNHLYYGDNLDILRRYVRTDSVDLIYLDPPFNSQQAYNVLFAERPGVASSAQVHAFEDTWHWDKAAPAYFEVVEGPDSQVSQALQAFRRLLGDTDLLAYLAMMAPRLIELRRVLKSTGSIYLHCDPTASHYLKILMDAIFGTSNFRNDIIWHYSGWNKKLANRFESRSDNLLFYGRGPTQVFNSFARPWKSVEEYVRVRKQKVRQDESGRPYVLSDAGEGKRVRRYLDEALSSGTYIDNVWTMDKLNNSSKERLGYQTQKPEALLERIIQASSNEGDVVLDPFCGCGTTVAVAQKLKRRWIGIDITHIAITLIRSRLQHEFPKMPVGTYDVTGEPTTLPEAQKLAADDKFQFQLWALGLVGARPEQVKKGADQGVDGRLFFHLDGGETRQVVLSVKGGSTGPDHIRDLAGVVGRDNAEIGVLITLQDATPLMRSEAAGHGVYRSPWGNHPRVQILTIADLLSGKRIDMPPPSQVNITFKRPPKATSSHPAAEQAELMRAEE